MKEFIDYLESKSRPSLSNLMYLISGSLLLICFVTKITSFRIGVSFIDNIEWKGNLNSDDKLVQITFLVVLGYILFHIVREKLVHIYQEETELKLRNIYVNIYTVGDILDLICSLIVLVFMLSVFIQMYNTEIMFISFKACSIYVVVIFKVFSFISFRFKVRNMEVIDKALNIR